MRRRPSALSGALACACAGLPALGAAQALNLQVDNPRPFGHFLGDVVTRHIEVTAAAGAALAPDALPKRGRLDAWLRLDDVTATARAIPAGRRYRIDLRYQIVNSPAQPQIASLPALTLHFSGGRPFDALIDPWPLAIAPLSPESGRGGLDAVRPLRRPALIDPTATAQRLGLCAVLAFALCAALAWRQLGWRTLPGRCAPFAAAHRHICSLARLPESEAGRRSALRALHRAFDQTQGERVFAAQLDAFCARHPQFRGLHDAARRFFAQSRDEFFAGGPAADATSLRDLASLSAQFAACERRPQARPARVTAR